MFVISVVLSIAIPALSSARHRGWAVGCLANMRSAGQLISVYANDHKDYVPFAGKTPWLRRHEGNTSYVVGGLNGVSLGTWCLWFPDHWSGPYWGKGLQCSKQPRFNPDTVGMEIPPLVDGMIQCSNFFLGRAYWIDPASLRPEIDSGKWRVKAARLSDVAFASRKSLLFEQVGFCVETPEAHWAIYEWGQTALWPTSLLLADGSGRRMAQKDGEPACHTWPFDATIDGVRGVDVK